MLRTYLHPGEEAKKSFYTIAQYNLYSMEISASGLLPVALRTRKLLIGCPNMLNASSERHRHACGKSKPVSASVEHTKSSRTFTTCNINCFRGCPQGSITLHQGQNRVAEKEFLPSGHMLLQQ